MTYLLLFLAIFWQASGTTALAPDQKPSAQETKEGEADGSEDAGKTDGQEIPEGKKADDAAGKKRDQPDDAKSGKKGAEPAEEEPAEEEPPEEEAATASDDPWKVIDDLWQASRSGNAKAFGAAITALRAVGGQAQALPTLTQTARSSNESIRTASLELLAEIASTTDDEEVAKGAIHALKAAGLAKPPEWQPLRVITNAWSILVLVLLIGLIVYLVHNQRSLTPLIATLLVLMILVGGAMLVTSDALKLWMVLTGAGAFGGFLFGMRAETFRLPEHKHADKTVNPGIIGDCAFGVAGAYVVFLVVPGVFDLESSWNVIKVLATAMVGGFGGRALMERVSRELLKEVQNIRKTVDRQQKELNNDATALNLLDRQLDPEDELGETELKELREALKASSTRVRVLAFVDARRFRIEKRRAGKLTLMERTQPIFEALIEADEEKKYHRNEAQLGYVLKDKTPPQWKEAAQRIEQAIEMRNKQGLQDKFKIYEFNLAICNIHLEKPGTKSGARDKIVSDLNAGLSSPKLLESAKESLEKAKSVGDTEEAKQVKRVRSWLDDNDAWGLIPLDKEEDAGDDAPPDPDTTT